MKIEVLWFDDCPNHEAAENCTPPCSKSSASRNRYSGPTWMQSEVTFG
jgi:hypothetical protein